MYLSIPALKEIVIDTISKKTNISRDRVKEVLEYDGPWTDHDRFLINTFMTAQQHAEDSGVDVSTAMGEIADFTELEGEESFKSAERLVEVSKETGQPLETIEAINAAYFDFIENVTTMMKKKLGRRDTL
ncbi:MAG: hypothetical protein MPW14_06155 [Candidatus Manganitrophus sp.]|nr:hypothetical protein [Candidatus Manganitrophus sp.]MDC4222993.1 hypothetical protein [Candidatus Manganitrophus sp.]WDT71350.1 MAG: hypothetical protein MPW17_00365 [Candidatus Manganitrophus sp.]WDT81325.1 MAG: hypothetical protein MPW14_06155 [Candidatus Manganitrophus sp.]